MATKRKISVSIPATEHRSFIKFLSEQGVNPNRLFTKLSPAGRKARVYIDGDDAINIYIWKIDWEKACKKQKQEEESSKNWP